MGKKFEQWQPRTRSIPRDFSSVRNILLENRRFHLKGKLDYGDHGLQQVLTIIRDAISENRKIALYADYDVDGTMSCVSWIWFFRAIGFSNYVHYIPCRFREGYGVNLEAVRHLIDDHQAQVIITMDTGITANAEAAYCRERGVEFICTDHHKIQPEKMPDCVILNPKAHPDQDYQELCGCGITFVLLRKLGAYFPVSSDVWNDILGLTGMATICDLVPLNGVNHQLARQGIQALLKSRRSVLVRLRNACSLPSDIDEKDVGFRLGPRINAVGRLDHADLVVRAFVDEDPDALIEYMSECNEQRKTIQSKIVEQALEQAELYRNEPVLFLGGDWHPGVVGIAASKVAEVYWRPTWLFQRGVDICKGSARSIPGFDVTEAMMAASDFFSKFGGHAAAGGFSFLPERESELRQALIAYAQTLRQKAPDLWKSRIEYDCELPHECVRLELAQHLDGLRPFGMGFDEPRFKVRARVKKTVFYNDKATGIPKHTAVHVEFGGRSEKIMYFNEVHSELEQASEGEFIVSVSRNVFRGITSLSLFGHDYAL